MPASDIFSQATQTDPDVIARGVVGVMIAATVDLHLRIEESVLLPALAGLPGVDPLLLAADLLAPGEAFILVNSHDPKPLRREFEVIHPGAISWDYLQAGPEEWRVRIGRVATDA